MTSIFDPKGLVREAYRIEGITDAECRSIFLDWALSLADGQDTTEAIQAMLQMYGTEFDSHPMTEVLRNGLKTISNPRRRGGWRSRERHSPSET